IDTENNTREPGYYVYPQGDREHGAFYEVGSNFTNDGSLPTGTVYIAEPYIKYQPVRSSFKYLDFDELFGIKKYDKAAFVKNHTEHMYYDGINDVRTYFKKIVLPDSIPGKMRECTPVVSTSSTMNEPYLDGPHPNIGITDSKELEVVVGNSTFENLYGASLSNGYGFMNNAELRRLEHFPSLREICKYTFWNCPKLEPLQNWTDFGPIVEIDEHAFDSCYVNPILNEKGGIIRRRFELPSSLRILGEYVFAKAVFTDFYLEKTNLTRISINSFAYSNDSSHSVEFAKVLAKYNAGTADLAALKAVANHVYFDGSKAEFETLIGEAYNETDVLLNKEYYVTFNN
ncbi:MAG: leucine-rich repeat protein, partial [Bacilli bacterium]|nr:leucine-rich repeat protein [Bacilli bacterium]